MVSGFGPGASGAGLRASLISAMAYDEACAGCQIEVTLTAQAIILGGIVNTAAALRALEIVRDIAGHAPIWDRMIWR